MEQVPVHRGPERRRRADAGSDRCDSESAEVTRAAAAGAGGDLRGRSPEPIALPADTVETTLAFIDTLPADGTASMQRDIMQGRPSELEAQVGAVVRLGERLGVAVPVHRMIYAALLPLEREGAGGAGLKTRTGRTGIGPFGSDGANGASVT